MTIDTRSPRTVYADTLAEMWQQADLDYQITASFPYEEYERLGLDDPERLITLVEARLRDAGYYGPYVIVVHDKWGKCLMHPHVLVQDNGRVDAIRQALGRHRVNLDDKDNGPIRGPECFLYCANRACERGPENRYWKFEPRHRRRPRPRGRGGKDNHAAT